MYRNLAPRPLGLAGCRDHELIELALTYRFAGITLNLERFQEQVQAKGISVAMRYWTSAKLRISSAEMTGSWAGPEVDMKTLATTIPEILSSLQELGCPLLTATLMAGHDELTYQKNFEHHCRRLDEMSQLLSSSPVKLALGFSALPADRAKYAHPFIQTVEALLALLQVVASPNIIAVVDLWHWTLGGGGVSEIERLGPDRIGDCLLADLPVGSSAATITSDQRFLPGTSGGIDAAAVLGLLARMRYAGPITPAPHSKQIQARTRDEAVGRVAQQLDELMRQAGLTSSSAMPTTASG
jgi:sugar phosphate isomerase/epimerase